MALMKAMAIAVSAAHCQLVSLLSSVGRGAGTIATCPSAPPPSPVGDPLSPSCAHRSRPPLIVGIPVLADPFDLLLLSVAPCLRRTLLLLPFNLDVIEYA